MFEGQSKCGLRAVCLSYGTVFGRPSGAQGTSSTDDDQGHDEHCGGEGGPGEVGADEPDRNGGDGHVDRTESLAEAQDRAIDGYEAPRFSSGAASFRSEKAGGRLRFWAMPEITVGTRSSHTFGTSGM